jgi:hypothetical protein
MVVAQLTAITAARINAIPRFVLFMSIHPALSLSCMGSAGGGKAPPPIYITIVMCSIPSVCVVVYQKNEKNTKNMKILSPAPQDLGGFMARNGV